MEGRTEREYTSQIRACAEGTRQLQIFGQQTSSFASYQAAHLNARQAGKVMD